MKSKILPVILTFISVFSLCQGQNNSVTKDANGFYNVNNTGPKATVLPSTLRQSTRQLMLPHQPEEELSTFLQENILVFQFI